MKSKLILLLVILAALAAAVLLLLPKRPPSAAPVEQSKPASSLPASGPAELSTGLITYQRRLPSLMSTVATLSVVADQARAQQASETLDEMEAVLRAVEARMNWRLADSELAKLNAAGVGETVALSGPMMEVLRRARDFTTSTQGAFDGTCRPILELWRSASQRKSRPTEDEIRQAVANTGWRWFELSESGAARKNAAASIDLGGIGKKYAIDRACEVMIRRGMSGGMINVGGDIRCFGQRVGGGPWRIGVRNPFSDDPEDLMAVVAVQNGSVCTSGNYERFVQIEGRRYSHIVDPRTGMPCDNAPSVTVAGPDATTAGLWATALSVLGVEGLKLMPPEAGLEVMIVIGQTPQDSRWYRTSGFDKLLVDRPSQTPAELPTGPSSAAASAPASRQSH
jgi:thiamine biosynthesis lipoprotein